MQGVIDDPEKKGITPRIINNIFEIISNSKTNIEFNVCISMIEIYMEKIRVSIHLNLRISSIQLKQT
jgi:kinesin family protein 5